MHLMSTAMASSTGAAPRSHVGGRPFAERGALRQGGVPSGLRAAGRQPRQAGAEHCRFVPPLIHFLPDSLTYSVPSVLKRRCDRTLGTPPATNTVSLTSLLSADSGLKPARLRKGRKGRKREQRAARRQGRQDTRRQEGRASPRRVIFTALAQVVLLSNLAQNFDCRFLFEP
jgi:hypothetical protein